MKTHVENHLTPNKGMAWVTIVCSRKAEIYIGHNPLGFVYPPCGGDYSRKRSIEQYLLPIGLTLELHDGFGVQKFTIARGTSSGVVMRAARATGSIKEAAIEEQYSISIQDYAGALVTVSDSPPQSLGTTAEFAEPDRSSKSPKRRRPEKVRSRKNARGGNGDQES